MKPTHTSPVSLRRLLLVLACSLLALLSLGMGAGFVVGRSQENHSKQEKRSLDGIMSLRTRIRLSENNTKQDKKPAPYVLGTSLALRD